MACRQEKQIARAQKAAAASSKHVDEESSRRKEVGCFVTSGALDSDVKP
jgi:hypothetical protein